MAVKLLNNKQPRAQGGLHVSGQMVIGLLFLVALIAFEMFNFDTTQYALRNLLGPVAFAGIGWATVLAVAFCAIDLAGLLRFFMPHEEGNETPTEVWYLMGAWLLGATMNALMTWWAVSLTLLEHDLGNEILSRQELLEIVPVFVAVLVWLTRILFIGAFTVAGGYLFDLDELRPTQKRAATRTAAQPQKGRAARQQARPLPAARRPKRETRRAPTRPHPATVYPVTDQLPPFLQKENVVDEDDGGDQAPAVATTPRPHRIPTAVQAAARSEA